MLYFDAHNNFNHSGATQGEDGTQGDINPVANNTYCPFPFRRDDSSPVRGISRQARSTNATPGANTNNIQATRQQPMTAKSIPQGKESKNIFMGEGD